MSTKAAEASKASTDKAQPAIHDWLGSAIGSLWPLSVSEYGGTEWAVASPESRSAIYQTSEKALEAARQIARVRSLSKLCDRNGPDEEERLDSIASSVALIGSLLTGPLPIPIASSGSDNGTTLFFDGDNFYGDLEIRGRSIEYYIKTIKDGQSIEIFDTEDIKDGYVPPRLLGCLFAHYAR